MNKTSVTSGKEKVPLIGLENVKLLATLDILNSRPQEGLNKIFSSKFKQPKVAINKTLSLLDMDSDSSHEKENDNSTLFVPHVLNSNISYYKASSATSSACLP
ncbi:hypothetical protein M9H77_26883 [Catharanthus roseus]|uniref:Uncharacterized protein n=1 Tax=Catharanthus roseus TaxID=4058 RepID=A0ACC0AB56_CATRO|nr:hypothetical protein M9H77_26883 [Catharanthus roseus]